MFPNTTLRGEATLILRNEHEALLHVMAMFEKALNRQQSGLAVPSNYWEEVVEFFTLFADKCHHGKEEDILFPLLEQYGIQREYGPIGVMLDEHVLGRSYIARMKDALELLRVNDNSGFKDLISAGTAYIQLLREHISKENYVLFAMADSVLPPELQTEVAEKFEVLEVEKMGAGTHEKLHARISEWETLVAQW